MNDFAKSQLMKYGWKEGKGLGKYESGITEPLKQKLKFDTAGVGYKDTDWNNWWENAFNKAARSIKVESQADEVLISVSKENTTNDLPKEELNKNESKYGNFLKTTTLLNGNLILENNSNMHKKQDIKEDIKHISLLDEELFKLCCGRTAHKGARHGLELNGKLKRIAEQEKYLLNTMKLENNIISHNNEYEEINDENIVLPTTSIESVMIPKKSKTTNRKNKRLINNLSHQLDISCNVSDSDKKNIHATVKGELKQQNKEKCRKRKREKEKRSSISCDIESAEKGEDNTLKYVVHSVAKKNIQDQINDHTKNKYTDTSLPTKKSEKKKKKKKLKKKKDQDNLINITDTWEDELHGTQAKKFKRSHKNKSDLPLINNEDIKTLDIKFQTEHSCNELAVKQVDTAKTLPNTSDAYLKKKVDYLNAKIKKKKRSKLHKKEKIKLDQLTESLKAVRLNTEESASKKYTEEEVEKALQKLFCIDFKRDPVMKQKRIQDALILLRSI
ncbi:G patch domain-containing protein 4 [Bombus pascuorum]|uniref:G patch domain-containing protein 4 n=1 Tax=Bombus pascuorum TaxID=65598 RepID=UPI00212CC704|nr:G patch domain-containing protein 4 [Bombus pascuorum]